MSDQVDLHQAALTCLLERTGEEKCRLATELDSDLSAGRLHPGVSPPPDVLEAGRPEHLQLVPPAKLPKRRLGNPAGRAAMIHALAHIEFNAINLACDAVYRFRGLPIDFYRDWCRIAREEAYHHSLLAERLDELGYRYGDFPAHDGLWEMALRTRADPIARMGLVPRVLEARGLDVTPAIRARFEHAGDARTCEILDIILRDEIGHVEVGTRWFRYLCTAEAKDPETTFFELLATVPGNPVSGPLSHDARRKAGFSDDELARLEALCASN